MALAKFALDLADADDWSFRKCFAESSKDTVKVPGLGEDAFMKSSGTGGHVIAVLKRPNIIQVQISLGAQDLEFGEALATNALGKL